MGYRSDVALAMTTDAAILMKALCDHDPELKRLIDDADEKYNWEEGEGVGEYTTKLMWANIKWYDGYHEVDCITQFMNWVSEEDWYFIRIGEETDDTVQSGGFWASDMYVSRTICL